VPTEQALAIAREIGDRRGRARISATSALHTMTLGETRKALECHEQALAIAREIGDRRGRGRIWATSALYTLTLGETRKALECYRAGSRHRT